MELLLYKKKALSLRRANSFLYSHICAHLKSSTSLALDRSFYARLLHCSEGEIAERLLLDDKAGRVKGVARQLYDNGFVVDASALLISAQSFHRELSTLNNALAYAKSLFSN